MLRNRQLSSRAAIRPALASASSWLKSDVAAPADATTAPSGGVSGLKVSEYPNGLSKSQCAQSRRLSHTHRKLATATERETSLAFSCAVTSASRIA